MAPTGGPTGGEGGNIKVVVRVRPFNNRELDRGARCVVEMQGDQTILQPPLEAEERLRKSGKGVVDGHKVFKYDKSYWSFDRSDSHFAGQGDLFRDLGVPLLENAFQGYNNCIFAYGQTGSGKSYSMMGYGEEPGVIPRICRGMFEKISNVQSDANLTCTVEVSYLEIYNEKVRDLLNPSTKGNLRVREHPSTGPYVEDLAKLAVRSFQEIENLMDEGNKARTVAATNMNETSSRSHAVFTLTLTQKRHDVETGLDTEKVAKISLVDLAGSERAASTGAMGARLKEGAEINRSLSTLGRVIAALADLSSGKKSLKVPYRDSVLTWLLKDSLGGNSLTAMVAAISPADINFEESLSTLRYADSAKRIKNHAVVNEDPNARMIRELKEELAQLRARLGSGGVGVTHEAYPEGTPLNKQMMSILQADGSTKQVSKADIMEQMSQSEKLYRDLNQTWEEKLLKTEEIHKERETALEELGISIEKGNVGLSTPKKMPHLVNLSDDPLLTECLVYNLKPGTTTVGNVEATDHAEIRLNGSKILSHHCVLENIENVVSIYPNEGAAVMVNGVRVDKAKRLKTGNRIILGDFHIFRFNNPLEAKAGRAERSLLRHPVTINQVSSTTPLRSGHERMASMAASDFDNASSRAESPISSARDSNWTCARREAASVLLGSDHKIGQLTEDELDHLFDNIQRAREERRPHPEGEYLEHDDDFDDLSNFLVRDKYTSGGTFDSFSLDNAFNLPDTPPQIGGSPDNGDVALKGTQVVTQKQSDALAENWLETFKASERSVTETEMQAALEEAKKGFESQMQKQKAKHDEEMTRHKHTAAPASADLSGYSDLSNSELATARAAVEKWQQIKFVSLAEAILRHAGLLKEAQVMSKLMDHDMSFQFVILDVGQDRPSAYDLILHDLSSEDDALSDARMPCLAVRVIDAKAAVIHLWSLDKLRQRVPKMRQLHQYIDDPEYRRHFRTESPFTESYRPTYSLIGDGSVPLATVFESRVQDYTADIVSPYSQNVVGRVKLSLEPSPADAPRLTLKFNIVMRDLSGFAEHEGTNVHAQLFVPQALDNSIATTQIMAGFGEGPIRFDSIHSLSVPEMDARTSFLKVAIYAEITTLHLDKLRSWDELREMAEESTGKGPTPRLSESEYHIEERHDVFAKVQILELTETGHYTPVEVVQSSALDDGIYQLHQGLQRRILISLTHCLTDSLPWDDLKSLRIGQLHLIDSGGKIADLAIDSPDIKLKQIQEPMVKDNADGTSNVTILGQWDSSLHKTLLLDRATSEQGRVGFSVRWDIVSSRLEQPMVFSINRLLQVLPRSYVRPQSILKSFWNQTRVTRSTDALFSIAVRTFNAKRAADLWRLDTSKVHINGEELLEDWAPRGISLVKDYLRARQKQRRLEEIEAVKVNLGMRELNIRQATTKSSTSSSLQPSSRGESLLRKYVALWQKPFSNISCPIFDSSHFDSADQSQSASKDVPLTLSSPGKEILRNTRYLATVTHTPKNPRSLKSGYLLMPSDNHLTIAKQSPNSSSHTTMQWKRRFVDLRSPYLHIHSVPDGEAINAINLTHARINHDPDFVRLLGGTSEGSAHANKSGGGLGHVFAVYGEQNTFLFAARSDSAKDEWILALDRSYFDGDEDGQVDVGPV